MIPPVGCLQKLAEEILPLASVESLRQESYDGKKRDFSRRTIVLGTVVSKSSGKKGQISGPEKGIRSLAPPKINLSKDK